MEEHITPTVTELRSRRNISQERAMEKLRDTGDDILEDGGNFSISGGRRRSSTSSGISGCDRSSVCSSNDGSYTSNNDEELMDDIVKDFGKTTEKDKVTPSSSEQLLRYIENNTIGNGVCFRGPFGERTATYCDYTASGRPLRFIENYINEHVYPLYANTHTTTNFMARQTTRFREEAREIIKRNVNASDEDVLIFSGSGTTGAIHKLVGVLEIKERPAKKTIVFVGPYEHHSNILPWKEAGATVLRIRDTIHGTIDTRQLRNLLKENSNPSNLLIGCFSAASNVTGITTDTLAITSLLHEFGALSFWDYATAAPYLDIDMNPIPEINDPDLSKDAIFLSPHKFVGGPGTPGVLIAKRRMFNNAVPTVAGGGTVLYVTRDTHAYLKNLEEREEGGTPAIVESVRAGLVFQLKDKIGTDVIERREKEFTEIVFDKFKNTKEIEILGSTTADRLPIFSFLIRHPETNKLLHHNYAAVLLNDLYGVQVRSGCACAGPYAQVNVLYNLKGFFHMYFLIGFTDNQHYFDLLGMDEDLAKKYTYFLLDNKSRQEVHGKSGHKREVMEIMKPGFTRFNLPYFASYEVVDYILNAIEDVAKNGWKLLPQYIYDVKSGSWVHRLQGETTKTHDVVLDSLHNVNYHNGKLQHQKCPYTIKHEYGKVRSQTFQKYLSDARKLYHRAATQAQENSKRDALTMESRGVDSNLVWFMQPHEAQTLLTAGEKRPSGPHQTAPFKPKKYADENWKPTLNKKKNIAAKASSNAKSTVCTIL
ncbi:uncharacterized protein [Antedon mediterranea]|uniref:uncharacterized protein n=1 Tax=Antedon mediterranea TaxID=105859 RepID=UPI003AF79549